MLPELPAQAEIGPLIEGVGFGFTVTGKDAGISAAHPAAVV